MDGGLSCTVCHSTFAPANSDTRGSLVIDVQPYLPGAAQIVRVTVLHPEASQWGFQVTARMMSDLTKVAGTFTVSDTVQVRCDDGRDAPCNGTTEFAEHRSPGKASGSFTVAVRWTGPATGGDVVFYAAGNAANGDGTLFSDRIYTTSKLVSSLSASTCGLTVKPVIRAAVSAASGQSGLTSNGLVSLFGAGFQAPGTTRAITAADLAGRIFPKQLACMAVEVGGQRAPLTYAQPDQVNLQVPSLGTGSSSAVVVIVNPGAANELRSDPFTMAALRPYAPAFFTFNGTSVAAQFAGTADIIANSVVVAGGRPARPGDIVTVYATGFGTTSPAWQAGELPDRASFVTGPVQVTLGGVMLTPAEILYAGLAPSQISGLYQFNLRLPATLPDGDLPIVISIGGLLTQAGASLPVRR